MLLRQKLGLGILALLFLGSLSMAVMPRGDKQVDVLHTGSPRDQTAPDTPVTPYGSIAEPAVTPEVAEPYYDPPKWEPIELPAKREVPTRGLHLEFLLPTHPLERTA